ncbi:hypothetical protein [Lentzea sp. NPDC060358]|uniref:hypothetical protein n=1 Tax=Lentzea sp. NPDC060358 TaxID=3347103 RepID=UPI003653E29C
MEVEVLGVLGSGTVHFSCAHGSAAGRWMSAGPVRTGAFHVEVEVPDEVASWSAAPGGPGLHGDPASGLEVCLDAEVVSFEAGDPVVAVRLGADVLLVEFADRAGLSAGARISFRVPEVHLYSTEL